MDQTNIFEFIYPKYHCTKPIRLIELFAGYGSQALALKYLGVPFEHWKICEWNYKSFQAYKQLHMTDDNTDYSAGLSKDELVEYLSKRGISSNWNEPMKLEQIKRLGEGSLREIYNNIQATHNLVDISQVHGDELEIYNTDQYTYIMTYSFPCQDLSLAGLRKGMSREGQTRSGLLWEVERILGECKEKDCLPEILLMENVPQVHGTGNEEHFREWQFALEKMGYTSYWQDLIATDYGIPQIRNRTFMVSIKGEYCYNFPSPIPLQKRLKDLLETEVDDKYYLSEKAINGIMNTTFQQTTLESRTQTKDGCIPTIAARDYKDPKLVIEEVEHYEIKRPHGYFPGSVKKAESISAIDASIDYQHIVIGEKKPNKALRETIENNEIPNGVSFLDAYNKTVLDNAQTITTRVDASSKSYIAIKNATKQGYLEAEEGDGVDISTRMEYHRGTVQKGLSQTLSTHGGGNQEEKFLMNDLRIRKLTPTECFRLMGVKDEDSEKLANMSNSTKYHLAGDSIVTTVLMAIFGELLEIEWKEKVKHLHDTDTGTSGEDR